MKNSEAEDLFSEECLTNPHPVKIIRKVKIEENENCITYIYIIIDYQDKCYMLKTSELK